MSIWPKLFVCVLGLLLNSAFAEATITHTTHNLNLRSGPDVSYPPISIIPAGAAIDVMSCGAYWCHIHWAAHLGYVNGDYLLTHETVLVAPIEHVHDYVIAHPVVHQDVVVHHEVVIHHVNTCRYLFC